MTTELRRGDIVYVEIPQTTGSEQSGVRPAVIIQNDTGNKFSPTVIVAYITSKNKNNLPTHISVLPDDETGLSRPSTLLFEQINTIDKKRVLSKVGQISESMVECINRAISVSLGLIPVH